MAAYQRVVRRARSRCSRSVRMRAPSCGDGDGVLTVRGACAGRRCAASTVGVVRVVVGAVGDQHRLDGDDQARPQLHALAGAAVVGDVRGLVHGAADAVAAVVGEHAVAGRRGRSWRSRGRRRRGCCPAVTAAMPAASAASVASMRATSSGRGRRRRRSCARRLRTSRRRMAPKSTDTRSPSASASSVGMPCTTASFTLTHSTAGNGDRRPARVVVEERRRSRRAWRARRRRRVSRSVVEQPGAACATTARSASATTAPAAAIASISASDFSSTISAETCVTCDVDNPVGAHTGKRPVQFLGPPVPCWTTSRRM